MLCIELKTNKKRGITLFEVLLYIGLFTIISTATVYLYISILKASDTLSLNIQKIEISIFMRQLALNQMDIGPLIGTNPYTSSYIDIQKLKNSMERILKYYPNLKLVDIQIKYMHTETNPQIIDIRFGTNVRSMIKLTYQLQSQSQSKKIFSNYVIISSI